MLKNTSFKYLAAAAGASVAASVSTFFLIKSLRRSAAATAAPPVPVEYIEAVHDILRKSRCTHESTISVDLQHSLENFESLIGQRISQITSSISSPASMVNPCCTTRLTNTAFICLDCQEDAQPTVLICEACASSSQHQNHLVFNLSTSKPLNYNKQSRQLNLEQSTQLFALSAEWNSFGCIDGITPSPSFAQQMRFCESNYFSSSQSYFDLTMSNEEESSAVSPALLGEIRSIFELLFQKSSDLSPKEFNGLLSIVLNQVSPLTISSAPAISSAIGTAMTMSGSQNKSVLAKIIRVPLDSQNANNLCEILLAISCNNPNLTMDITNILNAELKSVINSSYLTALLIRNKDTLLTNPTTTTSHALTVIIQIFNKCEDVVQLLRYKQKVLRCFTVAASAHIESIVDSPSEFIKAIAEIAVQIDKIGTTTIPSADFMKILLHTDISDSLIQIKEIDFAFSRLIMHLFTRIAAQSTPEQQTQFVTALIAAIEPSIYAAESSRTVTLLNIAQLHLLAMAVSCFNQIESIPIHMPSAQISNILKHYLFYSNDCFEILQLSRSHLIEKNPHNQQLLLKFKQIYGTPTVGEYDLLNTVVRITQHSQFIVELFSECHHGDFDTFQNLRFLFSDHSNQQNQLLINVMQILRRSATLGEIYSLLSKFTRISVEDINIDLICDISADRTKYTLKPIYDNEFYPLVFSKYPEYFTQLIALQKKHCKFQSIQSEFFNASASTNSDSDFNSVSSMNNEDMKKQVISINQYTRNNCDDLFGSDYDLFLMKPNVTSYHESLMLRILYAIKGFFLLGADHPSLTQVVSLYLRIALYQQTEMQHDNINCEKTQQIPQVAVVLAPFLTQLRKLRLNQYLVEDLEKAIAAAASSPNSNSSTSSSNSSSNSNNKNNNSVNHSRNNSVNFSNLTVSNEPYLLKVNSCI